MLTLSDFPAFFDAVHRGRKPFRWQTELLQEASTGWPDTIALPTSSGKTSVIDLAVFLLALEADKRRSERVAALRTFFVVDRRVVVDQAYEHALDIARALERRTSPVCKEVAERLSGFRGQMPLQVSRLRGGVAGDSAWADEPNQPLICVSTVDQIGSRLLFRGYQTSKESRPVHAALAANDSIVFLDEAHLSQPFATTVKTIRERYAKNETEFPRIISMSATPAAGGRSFSLRPEWVDADDKLLERLRASKPAELRSPKKLEEEAASLAKEFGKDLANGVVGVVVNTIASAREVFKQLDGDKVLLIGRNRPYCAEALWERYKTRIAANRPDSADGLLYVVATQTVEVGADISFDAMVTESAPLDALRQRFGRLNRLGRRTKARSAVLKRPKADPVYGSTTENAWALLTENQPVDFGVVAMDYLLEKVDPARLKLANSIQKEAPVLLPGHLKLWAQTNPEPYAVPDAAPFLHGHQTEPADVQVVWRRELKESNLDQWGELIKLAPPMSREALSIPFRAFKAWLRSEAAPVTDLEGLEDTEEEKPKYGKPKEKPVLVWNADADDLKGQQVLPGSTVIVPESYGGIDEYGWGGDKAEVDIFDEVNKLEAEMGRRQRIVRLEIAARGNPEAAAKLEAYQNDPDPRLMESLLDEIALERKGAKIDQSARVATWPRKRKEVNTATQPETQETDESDGSSFTARRTLKQHTDGVVEHVKRYANGCGLEESLVRDLVLAAELHDLGKWDERFQEYITGRPFDGVNCLAKSGNGWNRADDKNYRERAGYPRGARHEAASVVASCASGLLENSVDRDLVIHLIGSHHGWGRPWMPTWREDSNFRIAGIAGTQPFECSSGQELGAVGSGWAERFERLNQKYGYWGLAYLESILRRADCMQSRKEADNAAN